MMIDNMLSQHLPAWPFRHEKKKTENKNRIQPQPCFRKQKRHTSNPSSVYVMLPWRRKYTVCVTYKPYMFGLSF